MRVWALTHHQCLDSNSLWGTTVGRGPGNGEPFSAGRGALGIKWPPAQSTRGRAAERMSAGKIGATVGVRGATLARLEPVFGQGTDGSRMELQNARKQPQSKQ